MLYSLNKAIFIEKSQAEVVNGEALLSLPERIIQFGNGVLLRGLPDYYVDRANKLGQFNGRIVVVKTTSSGNLDDFEHQDYLYTHTIKGFEANQLVNESLINCSISRVLPAGSHWTDILQCAENPEINIVLSNTTEQGMVYEEESIFQQPPNSFPAKLLAYLWQRFQVLGDSASSKIIVIPTELIENNGDVLKAILTKLISFNQLDALFAEWFQHYVTFCNSLVDRIVPGKPNDEMLENMQADLGYKDNYLIVSEPYQLWAIEGPDAIKDVLSFASCNPGIKIAQSIEIFKELKLRLLNATHTFSAGVALQHGLVTVYDAMNDGCFSEYIQSLVDEIKRSFAHDLDDKVKTDFANDVLDRFRNSNIEHFWSSIIFNYSEKFKIRCIPLLIEHYRKHGHFAPAMIKGLAFYFEVAIPDSKTDGKYYNIVAGGSMELNDPMSEFLFNSAENHGFETTVKNQLEMYFFNGLEDTILVQIIDLVFKELKPIAQN